MDLIFLDYNATTPIASEVEEAICSSMKNAWANPSSSYALGKTAKLVMENSRSKVAHMIGAQAQEIIFTSGGTEANNMVIHSSIQQYHKKNSQNKKPHIISTNIEHDSVNLPLQKLVNDEKAEVSFISVSKRTGQVVVDDILDAIRPHTCLITVMLANNETGVIQPVSEIGFHLKTINQSRACKHRIYFHTDAAQAIGKIEVDVTDLNVDFLTIVGHKFYGPRIGALYFKFPTPLHPMLHGGGQERQYRPGTENVCLIAGLGKAAELVTNNVSSYHTKMKDVREHFEKSLKTAFGNKVVFHNSDETVESLPNTISAAFRYDNVTGREILASSSILCASTGAACQENSKPSQILMSCGISEYLAARTLRLSIGRETTIVDTENAISELQRVITELLKKPKIQ